MEGYDVDVKNTIFIGQTMAFATENMNKGLVQRDIGNMNASLLLLIGIGFVLSHHCITLYKININISIGQYWMKQADDLFVPVPFSQQNMQMVNATKSLHKAHVLLVN